MIKKTIFLLVIMSFAGVLSVYVSEGIKQYANREESKISSEFIGDQYTFIGKKDRIGFHKLNGNKAVPFAMNHGGLYIWRFIEEYRMFTGAFTLKARHFTGEERILVDIKEPEYVAIKNGVELRMKINALRPGEWELKAYIGEVYFDSVMVVVKQS